MYPLSKIKAAIAKLEPQDELLLRALRMHDNDAVALLEGLQYVMHIESDRVAVETGNYSKAGELSVASDAVGEALEWIDNYDPTPE